MITERAIHNYFKWLEKEEAKAIRKQVRYSKHISTQQQTDIACGEAVAFAKAKRRLKKLL